MPLNFLGLGAGMILMHLASFSLSINFNSQHLMSRLYDVASGFPPIPVSCMLISWTSTSRQNLWLTTILVAQQKSRLLV